MVADNRDQPPILISSQSVNSISYLAAHALLVSFISPSQLKMAPDILISLLDLLCNYSCGGPHNLGSYPSISECQFDAGQ